MKIFGQMVNVFKTLKVEGLTMYEAFKVGLKWTKAMPSLFAGKFSKGVT